MSYRIIKGYIIKYDHYLNFEGNTAVLTQADIKISNTTDTFKAKIDHKGIVNIYYYDENIKGLFDAYGDIRTGDIFTGVSTLLPIEEVNKKLERFNQGYDEILDLRQ